MARQRHRFPSWGSHHTGAGPLSWRSLPSQDRATPAGVSQNYGSGLCLTLPLPSSLPWGTIALLLNALLRHTCLRGSHSHAPCRPLPLLDCRGVSGDPGDPSEQRPPKEPPNSSWSNFYVVPSWEGETSRVLVVWDLN